MAPRIPTYQTLGRKTGWRWQRVAQLPYPLSHDRMCRYSLGRNAVFHGARALDLGPGDEVLFPAYHSGTEAAPLMHLGCRLRFYGVGSDLSLDLHEIEAKIGPRTRAIYVIHFFGFQAPVEAIRTIADRHGLLLIEDVALGFLGDLDGRPLGTWGDVSIFCLYKSLPVAAGGVLAINKPDVPLPPEPQAAGFYSDLNLTIKHVIHHWELHGGKLGRLGRNAVEASCKRLVQAGGLQLNSPESLDFEPDLLNDGMGLVTRLLLRYFDYESVVRRRRANYDWLTNRFADTGVVVLRENLPAGAVPLFLPILVEDKFPSVDALHRAGVEAVPVWGIHHSYLKRGEFPGTEFLVNHAVEIPIFQDLTEAHLERIADDVIRICRVRDEKILERSATIAAAQDLVAC
jgi:dTDP-4-amino-4,6-dideoxygalactose transaminase